MVLDTAQTQIQSNKRKSTHSSEEPYIYPGTRVDIKTLVKSFLWIFFTTKRNQHGIDRPLVFLNHILFLPHSVHLCGSNFSNSASRASTITSTRPRELQPHGAEYSSSRLIIVYTSGTQDSLTNTLGWAFSKGFCKERHHPSPLLPPCLWGFAFYTGHRPNFSYFSQPVKTAGFPWSHVLDVHVIFSLLCSSFDCNWPCIERN